MPYDEPAPWAAGEPTQPEHVDRQRPMQLNDPAPWAQTAYAPSGYAPPPQPPARQHSQGPWIFAAVVVAVVVLAAAIVLGLRSTRSTEDHHVDGPTSGVIARQQHVPDASAGGPEPAGAPQEITFDGMRDFISGLYGELPANAVDAWSKLDTGYQQRTGYSQYLDFWGSIESVTLISVTPRDATSVVARLRFVTRDGRSDTEDRWLSVVLRNGVMLVYDSERIGSV